MWPLMHLRRIACWGITRWCRRRSDMQFDSSTPSFETRDARRETRSDSDRIPSPESRVPSLCFHCHEPIPARTEIVAHLKDREERVCCHGCKGIAELIAGAGLEDYYRFRERAAQRIEPESEQRNWNLYDQPELLAQISHSEDDGSRTASFVLEGIGCAACGWLINRMLMREPGVGSVTVSTATAR